jgi:energy-coupling factor transport system ATP-binding protein
VLIEVQNLSHTFASGTPLERRALRNVSLRIEPGERVGIAGRTGSGKSTLVQHLAGLLQPTAGCVRLDGTPAHRGTAAARRRRRRVGIAFQYPEDQIFEQTVFREVAFGPRNLGVKEQEVVARVDWALTAVGLDSETMLDRTPFTLSGGEMRRVALASILALRPNVLILDEPTAGLDPRGRRELLERLAASRATPEMTLIVVSHDLDSLARVAERIIVLRDGEVAADAPTRRVLTSLDALDATELDPPTPVVLLRRLRSAGLAVATDRITPEEAAAEIARALSHRPHVELSQEDQP